ncbi:TPA: reverse transcriptase N-terminal domain-containing protein [Escherichia coli]
MNTHISVSTIPHPTGWHTIDWKACHARVRKLQLRIAKATRQQQWRQVRELQRILTPEKDCGGSPDDTSPLKAGAGSLKP